MAGASLLALRSISSMTPCTSGPDRLWNSIAAGSAGPGARLLQGRACPPPQLPGAPGANGPSASPPRPRPRPSSAAPQRPGSGPRAPAGQDASRRGVGAATSRGAWAAAPKPGSQGHGRGRWRRWRETRADVGARRGRFHAAGIARPASALRAQSRGANCPRRRRLRTGFT